MVATPQRSTVGSSYELFAGCLLFSQQGFRCRCRTIRGGGIPEQAEQPFPPYLNILLWLLSRYNLEWGFDICDTGDDETLMSC